MTWTAPARVELLKRLWIEGLTASHIAARLGGVTRNAVIGKVRRLNLPYRDKPDRNRNGCFKTMRAKPHGVNRRKALAVPSIRDIVRDGTPIPSPAETDIARVSSADLDEGNYRHCKWPVGDPRDGAYAPLFCGDTRVPGLPYCPNHVRRAYQPPQPRRQEALAPVPILEAA